MKCAALISGGKDSIYAAYASIKQGHEVICLVNLLPEKKDSWMFHVPNAEFVKEQAEAMEIPLISLPSSGVKEEELKDLKDAVKLAVDKYKIEGLVSGALASNYQKERIDLLCKELKLESITPLWHINPQQYIQALILDNFEVIMTGIAADGFSEEWLGRKIDRNALLDLIKLNRDFGIHIGGEGGEYETFVLDCPLFKKRIIIEEAENSIESENTGQYIIKKLKLVKKNV